MLLTIIDRTLKAYNTVEALFDTALLNGIGITDEVAQDVAIIFSAKDYQIVAIEIKNAAALGIVGQQMILKHQKPTDFVTQFAGTREALFEVSLLNGKGITDEIAAGSLLKVNVKNRDVVNFYKAQSATDITTLVQDQPGGIGYMQIGSSFIVS